MDNTFATILTGTNCHAERTALDWAVANRFNAIRDGLTEQAGDFCYDGNRTSADSLGWRFRQMHGDLNPDAILMGAHDAEIEATYHEAASSEHYYRYEKDWGSFE